MSEVATTEPRLAALVMQARALKPPTEKEEARILLRR